MAWEQRLELLPREIVDGVLSFMPSLGSLLWETPIHDMDPNINIYEWSEFKQLESGQWVSSVEVTMPRDAAITGGVCWDCYLGTDGPCSCHEMEAFEPYTVTITVARREQQQDGEPFPWYSDYTYVLS
jgi:hypothetical protein